MYLLNQLIIILTIQIYSEKEYLHVYEGIGEVWILPTLSCYEDFSEDINEKQEQ